MDRSQKTRFNKLRKLALTGNYKESIPDFRGLKAEGVIAAAASLAEIFGFLFDWERCLENAGNFIAAPDSTYAGNVFDDMVRLVARAGKETSDWYKVIASCRDAVQKIAAGDHRPFQKTRYVKILKNLQAFAENKGEPADQELIGIFETASDRPEYGDRRAAYLQAIERTDSGKANETVEETVRKKFALAIAYEQEEDATKVFLENESLSIWDFQMILPAIKHLVKNQNERKAWQVIQSNIPNWIPVDLVQIAPVELLVDRDLKTIMSKERCLEVLQIDRA